MPDMDNLKLDKPDQDPNSAKNQAKKQQMIDTALDNLHGVLNTKFSKYVSHRYDKEAEWQEAEELYNGARIQNDGGKLAALHSLQGNELPTVNITRPKTNIAIARLQDVQFPLGGDMNFSVEATPMPEMVQLQASQEPMPEIPGQPPQTIGQASTAAIRTATDKAKRMEMRIHDRFVETDWAKRCRRAMEQMGILGTAIVKAPVLTQKRKKKYSPLTGSDGAVVRVLDYDKVVVPTVQWVDIRMWFPDPSARPGGSIEDCFEYRPMTSTELRNLARDDAFMPNRIRECLMEEPIVGHVAKSSVYSILDKQDSSLDKRYSVIEYHGAIDKDILFELEEITEEERDDPLVIVQGEVWFVNGRIIRVSVAPLEGEETIPYQVCTWEDDPASVFGHGIPYLMRHAQRVANSSWLMLLDNAGLTAGPQIVLNKEMIEPANKSEGWNIRPMKVWFMTEYGADVKEAMQFVNVPTQQDSITNIIEMALNFADVESSIPQMLQGDAQVANNTTFGGMAMVMSASHIIQQRISERWDDYITVPTVQRFYHYEMQYGEDDSIKGDYEVKAGGATERIDKQIKAQDLERIIGMAGTNEMFLEQVDLGEAFREWVCTTRAGDILKDRAVIEQERAQAQQAAQEAPDPVLMEAQARLMQAEAAKAKIELDRELKAQEHDLRAQIAEAMVDKESREIVAREHENQIKLQIAQMAREDQLIAMASKQDMTQAELAAKLDIAVMSDRTNRLLKQADLDKFNTEVRLKQKFGEGI